MYIIKRKIIAASILALLILAAGSLSAQDFAASTPNAVALSCDGKGSSPENVSTYNPMLSWTFSDADVGDAQSSYDLQVRRDDNGAIVWDLADQALTTGARMYNGNLLEPNTLYNWSVQVLDRADQPSAVASASFQILDIGLRAFDGMSTITIATDEVNIAAPVTDTNRLRISANGTIYYILTGGVAEYGASKIHVQIPSGTRALKTMALPEPVVGLGPGYLTFTAPAGSNPGPQSISATNVGGGALSGLSASINYDSGSNWLSTSFDTTSAPATLTVTPSAASLAAGVYTATVAVSSGAATNSPQALNVILQLTSSVTYSANGAASGSAPTDPNGYLPGASVTVLGNSGSLARTGYNFSGWQVGGAGTIYSSGQTFTIGGSDVTLEAAWTPIQSTVNFDSQGGSLPSPTSKVVTYDSTYGTLPSTGRAGFSFGGWYTGTGGSGSQITSGTTVSISSNDTLYAYWIDSWTTATMPASTMWFSVAYGNGTFVATGAAEGVWDRGTAAATSADGVSWTQRTMPSSQYWTTVTYGEGKFVALGYASDQGAISTDGASWTSIDMPINANWMSVTHGNGTFVAIAEGVNGLPTAAASSADGVTWTLRTLPANDRWSEVTYGNGVFVAVGGNNTSSTNVATSADGATWTLYSLPSAAQWSAVAFGNGTFVATAMNSSKAATSTNGTSWTARTLPYDTTWLPIGYGESFIVVSYTGANFATSPDGITWMAGTMPSDSQWDDVAYGNGTYVVVARASNGTTVVAVDP